MASTAATRARIALVQNQSEMAHYGYADARGTLADLGFDVTLFTRENAALLEVAIRDRAFDAIVLGSQALSDAVLAEVFAAQDFCQELAAYLESGRGLLCLHQLGLASRSEGSELNFLPATLRPVKVAKKHEPAGRGRLTCAPGTSEHPLLCYPHLLDLSEAAERAVRFGSLPGLYWHSWTGLTAAWEDIVVDETTDPPASLAVASQATSRYRVVLLAMPIDWQRNLRLLENALVYAATGWEATALLRLPAQEASAAPSYLAATLRAWRYPFREYDLDHGEDVQRGDLVRHLVRGLHRTLVLAPGTGLVELPPDVRSVAEERIAGGDLRVVALGDTAAGEPSYSVYGREHVAIALLGAVELEVQGELNDGYVAGSFWATVEVLQTLEDLPQRSRDYRDICARALALADTHDSDGSYDEVLSATAALFWLRSFAGAKEEEGRSLRWLRAALASQPSPRDGIYALGVLCANGVATAAERVALQSRIERYPLADASEVDLLTILRTLRYADIQVEPSRLDRLIEELIRRADADGLWLDISISAAIVVELLKLGHPRGAGAVQRAMTCIQRSRSPVGEEASGSVGGLAYQWGRHPLTTLRCLQAWLLFDAQLRFAVDEVVENLRSRERFLRAQSTTRSALRVLDELRADNTRLRKESDELSMRLERTADLEAGVDSLKYQVERLATWRFAWAALALLLLYVLVFTLVGAFSVSGRPTLDALVKHAVSDKAVLHAVVVSAVVGLLAVDWRRRAKGGSEAS